MNKRKATWLTSAVLGTTLIGVVAGCGGGGSDSNLNNTNKTVVSFDTATTVGSVNPLLFGVNHRWVAAGVGSADPVTGITYPLMISQMKDVGFTMVRYPGGTLANLFQWTKAIGPQAQRGRQVGGLPIASLMISEDSAFGPDEYGKMLDETGAAGDLLLNVGTADPADSANFIAYMTLPQGSAAVNGVDWAAKRAANGHPAPYKIAYAEMGNQQDPSFGGNFNGQFISENYWIDGTAVTFTNPACSANKIECLYTFGGSTSFSQQPVVQLDNWTPATSVSSGAAGQVMFVRYAPVKAASETVTVAGVTWQSVPSLAAAINTDTVYQINATTGAIQFGDGVHGAIPATGAKVLVSYTTAVRSGFVDYYKAIKAVNPSVRVCSSVFNSNFIQLMGSQYAYDCLVLHPYQAVDATKITTLPEFFGQAMQSAENVGTAVRATQDTVKQYAGANAAKVGLLLSEYGHTGTMPAYAPHFQRSLGDGIQQGLFLRQLMVNGVEAADRHTLVDYTYGTAPADLAAVSAGDRAVIQGPGPNTIVSPTALGHKLFVQNTGTKLVQSTVVRNPSRKLESGQTLDSLQTVATTDAAGNAYLIVINQDPTNAVNAVVAPVNTPGRNVTISTLNSANITDENNQSSPNAVQIAQSSAQIGLDGLNWTFPAHSITALKIAK